MSAAQKIGATKMLAPSQVPRGEVDRAGAKTTQRWALGSSELASSFAEGLADGFVRIGFKIILRVFCLHPWSLIPVPAFPSGMPI
jgi:hypothetical protein